MSILNRLGLKNPGVIVSSLALTLALAFAGALSAEDLTQRLQPGQLESIIANRVDPVYPPAAKVYKLSGTVVVEVVITAMGDVKSTKLVSGHPVLAPAALAAVKQWKFNPPTLAGGISKAVGTVEVKFDPAAAAD